MRELMKPPEVESDPRATEMVRAWIANNDLHVSLFLGMWQDAKESDVDECDAWGQLLSDLVHHIANGMRQSHGWDTDETVFKIRTALVSSLDADNEPEHSGAYVDEDGPKQ